MPKRSLMLKHLAEIAAVDPAAAAREPDVMLGFVLRLLAIGFPK
jgi:hypothetical protein